MMRKGNGLSEMRMSGGKGRLVLAVVLACAVAASACSTGTSTKESDAEPHPMDAQVLSEVMRGFDSEVRSDIPAETDEYDRWDGVFPRIAEAAATLKASAIVLMGKPPKGLELQDRGRFQVLAKSLSQAAAELEDAAARGDADAVEIARKNLGTACRDCHNRFRPKSPGVPEAFR